MEDGSSAESVKEFVIAGHGNLLRVKKLLAQNPGLLNAGYNWTDNDKETAMQAAAQVGSVPVAEFLLSSGAPLEICTAAMLGKIEDVQRFLRENPESICAKGAHGIPLLPHAALSGNAELVRMLVERGSIEGTSFALHNAVGKGYIDVARWLLENAGPDLNWKNYQGKTALMIAIERKDAPMEGLLKEHGAVQA